MQNMKGTPAETLRVKMTGDALQQWQDRARAIPNQGFGGRPLYADAVVQQSFYQVIHRRFIMNFAQDLGSFPAAGLLVRFQLADQIGDHCGTNAG